jgi:uroporphyrinogen III methyltransferase/synthase
MTSTAERDSIEPSRSSSTDGPHPVDGMSASALTTSAPSPGVGAAVRDVPLVGRVRRPAAGHVAFVGAGPGDPGLLTVRAIELLRAADVVLLEHAGQTELVAGVRGAVSEDGAAMLPPAEVCVIGTDDAGVPLTTSARARLVTRHAKSGAAIVRLVDGDPFTYATGPEEAQACVKAGLSFEVVPGISALSAVPTYAGVPLTTRNSRELSVLRLSGPGRVDWRPYAGERTVVVLCDLDRLAEVVSGLCDAGRLPETPVAVTTVGTTTDQQTVTSTLRGVVADVAAAELSSSAVVVVGEVVGLRGTLSWFETKPLFGWRVLVPRTKEQAGELSARLRAHGAVPQEVPTISVEPPRNPQQMDKAVRGLVEGRYEWVAFTSANAVRALREKFDEYGLDARAFSGLKVAAVGDRTAEAVQAWGIRPDLVPQGEQSARGLLEEWPPFDKELDPINRVFLPRADIATETLVAGLHELGWEVDDVTAYRTVRAAPPPAPVREAIKTGRFDAVVFTSSSTVRNLVGIAGKPHPSTVIACIGPATVATAQEHGLRVDVMADAPSARALADALADLGAQRRQDATEAGETVSRPSLQRRGPVRRKA